MLCLDLRVRQPDLRAGAVASAKALETEMVAEGLDFTFDFFTLLSITYTILEGRRKRGNTNNESRTRTIPRFINTTGHRFVLNGDPHGLLRAERLLDCRYQKRNMCIHIPQRALW